MAYIVTDPNKRRRIQLETADGKRKTIRLGKVSKEDAEVVLSHVKRLNAAQITNSTPPPSTHSWIAGISDRLRDRLRRAGLCDAPPQQPVVEIVTLAATIQACLDRRLDIKASTRATLLQAKGHVTRILGDERDVATITEGDADDFRRKMLAEYSKAYTSKMITITKSFFRDAVRRRLLAASPFADLKPGSQKNSARQFMVDHPTIQRVIDVAADPEWKLLIALARYGGLRVPSEPLMLRWSDVNWTNRQILVTSPKTEHHEGKGQRLIPLFPELEPYLRAVQERAEPDCEFVITRYRSASQNLRTQLLRFLSRAEVKPWPRLWQNLRASRATELADQYPSHVCAAWLGHTEAIADRHYRQVTDAHFQRASGIIEVPEKATQVPTQQPSVFGCNGVQESGKTPRLRPEIAGFAVIPQDTKWAMGNSKLAPKCLLFGVFAQIRGDFRGDRPSGMQSPHGLR